MIINILQKLKEWDTRTKTVLLYLGIGVVLVIALALTILLVRKREEQEGLHKIGAKQPSTVESLATISNFSGKIEFGETKRHTFLVDAEAVTRFTVLTLDADLEMVIYDPEGVRISSNSAAVNPNIEYGKEATEELGEYVWYTVQNPTPGKWEVEITASTSGQYVVSVEIESAISLVASTDKGSYRIGEEARISAFIRNEGVFVTGADVTAEMWNADRAVEKLTLYDDGTHGDTTPADGVYFNVYPGFSIPGYVGINVTATTSDITRVAERHIVVIPDTATLASVYNERPIDTDGDGLYDILQISVEVDINTAGHYEIAGYLGKEPLEPTIAYAEYNTHLQGDPPLSSGKHYIPLKFHGEHIRMNGLDGPYQVQVILYDQNDTSIQVGTNAGEPYITKEYKAEDFQN